ncbi:hypothetical protein D3C71_1350040 [compost metagenome]
MAILQEMLNKYMKDYVIRFKYIKDNLHERELISTLSIPALSKCYDSDYIAATMLAVESVITRGYVRVPEFGASRYDKTGVRALNLSRITSMEVVEPDSVDLRFVDVDFAMIEPHFVKAIEANRSMSVLGMIHEDLLSKPANVTTLFEMQNNIVSYVQSQIMLGTTMYLRFLHTYMVQRQQLFPLYNSGKPTVISGMASSFGTLSLGKEIE